MPRPQLLFLAHRVPYPPNRGDRIRSYHLLRHLAHRFDVSLACLADEPVSDEIQKHLGSLCQRVSIVPVGRERWLRAIGTLAGGRSATEGLFSANEIREAISNWCGERIFQVAFAFCSSMAPYLAEPGLKSAFKVLDMVDVDSQKWFEYAKQASFPKRGLYQLEGVRVEQLERLWAGSVNATLLVSEAEAELFRSRTGAPNVHAISNGVDLDYYHPSALVPDPETCVFVGALDYQANIDGILWFLKQVWGQIRKQRPQARLRVVGREPVSEILAWEGRQGVEVIANPADVRPALHRSMVALAPLRVARGIQNKILEALAAGKPIVASPQAFEGIEAEGRSIVQIAVTPADWCNSIVALLGTPPLREKLGCIGRQFVERSYQWHTRLAPLDHLLDPTVISYSSSAVAAVC